MKNQEKLSLLKQLIKLARTDKAIREEEYEFLRKIAEMLGIDEPDFKLVFEENIDFSAPELETDRILQFHRLVLLANIDTSINEKELDFLRSAGLRLGLHPDAVEEVFVEMRKAEHGMIDPDILIHIFQVYHN